MVFASTAVSGFPAIRWFSIGRQADKKAASDLCNAGFPFDIIASSPKSGVVERLHGLISYPSTGHDFIN